MSSKSSPRPAAESVPNQNAEMIQRRELLRRIDAFTVPSKLGLVIRLCEALEDFEPGGIEEPLDNLFWRGLNDLLRECLRECEELQLLAGTQASGFVMLEAMSTEKGGA